MSSCTDTSTRPSSASDRGGTGHSILDPFTYARTPPGQYRERSLFRPRAAGVQLRQAGGHTTAGTRVPLNEHVTAPALGSPVNERPLTVTVAPPVIGVYVSESWPNAARTPHPVTPPPSDGCKSLDPPEPPFRGRTEIAEGW